MSYLINQLSDRSIKKSYIFVSIEKQNETRAFCYFTTEKLIILYSHCPSGERALYEIILPTNITKTYVDFEHYIDNNVDIKDQYIEATCFLKILHYIINCFGNSTILSV